MKFSELKQAMDWRRRVGFNGGGYVKKKVLPQPKPKEEAEKVNKARKEKTFEKAKPALENPKEVKEMIDKPKRGLVDEPGSYSQPPKAKTRPGRLPDNPKVAAKNIAAWKKANPNLNFDILDQATKFKIRRGNLTAGTLTKLQKNPNIYTISDLAKLDGMPYTYETLAKDLVSKKSKAGKRIQKAFKEAGIELLPKKAGQTTRYKILNVTKSMEKLTDYLITRGGKPPQKLVEPYKKQIPIEYKKLVKSGKPFSVTSLKNAVFKSLPENVYKIGSEAFDALIRRTLTETQRKKFTLSTVIQQTENLQPRKIIIDNILDGKTNIKQLAKASDLSEQEVGDQIQRIFRTIYQSREKIGAKKEVRDVILKDYSLKDFEKILTNINKEPTLDSYFRQGYRDFLFEAIGNPNNPDTYQPKKYARAIERLIAYESINKKLEEAFGIKLTLDHSVSRTALKSIVNAEPSQFLRVNPIPENINAGIKKSFDIRYRNVVRDLKSSQFRGEELKNLLKSKVELEKLSKDIGLQFGKISPTGKIIKYDAVDFLNKNLPSEIKAGVSLPNKIRQAVDKIDPTVLKERFKVAFGEKADDALEILNKIKKQDNLQDIYKFLKPLLKVKGLRVDASDFLNQASEVIFPTLQAAEVLPGEAQAATPKPMDFDLDMSLPTPTKKDITAETTAALTPLVMKYGPSVAKGLGNIFNRLGTPLFQAAYAAVDPASLMFSAPFTQASNVPSGVYKQPKGIMQKLSRSANRLFLPRNIAPRVIQGLSRASTFGFPVFKAGEELFKTRGRIRDFEQRMTPMERNNPENFQMTAAGRAPKELVRQFMRELPQDAFEYTGAAGGGLLKQAGDRSGKPPEAGPNSQGLDFLMKRGR